MEKRREDGWEDMPPLPRDGYPVGSSLRAAEERGGTYLLVPTELRVQCPECSADLGEGSLAVHWKTYHGFDIGTGGGDQQEPPPPPAGDP